METARLFAGVDFTTEEKQELYGLSARLRQHCRAGRFPPAELLHVTLHFFGRTPLDRLHDIEKAIHEAARGRAPFTLTTGRAGTFGRRDSAVLWLGVGGEAGALNALQAALEGALFARGFARENRAFRAHITLGRDVAVVGNIGEVELPGVSLHANAVMLMESTQRSGRLEYVPLLRVPLQPADS